MVGARVSPLALLLLCIISGPVLDFSKELFILRVRVQVTYGSRVREKGFSFGITAVLRVL